MIAKKREVPVRVAKKEKVRMIIEEIVKAKEKAEKNLRIDLLQKEIILLERAKTIAWEELKQWPKLLMKVIDSVKGWKEKPD